VRGLPSAAGLLGLIRLVPLLLASGCALLGKSEPLEPRYFSPESASRPVAPAGRTPRAGPPPALRIGRIGSGSYLKERIVWRDADHELNFYDDRRWTERPEVYLLRALDRALFEEAVVTRSVRSSGPTLTASLSDFEEVRRPVPGVRLRVNYVVHDEQRVFCERTLTVERPLPDGTAASQPRRVASAMGAALQEAASAIVADVLAALPAARAPEK
jgi:ABC-type uncharacterized transport system auxiliary subunit